MPAAAAAAVVDLDEDIAHNRTPSGWPLATRPPSLSCPLGPERRVYSFQQGQHGSETGDVLWPSSRLLSRFVEARCSAFAGAAVLELGAGCALAGVTAAACGARAVLTDRCTSLTGANAAAAAAVGFPGVGCVSVEALDWTRAEEWLGAGRRRWDWVLVADCIYHQQNDFSHLEALAGLLAALLQASPPPRAALSTQERDPAARAAFFAACARRGLSLRVRTLPQLAAEGLETAGQAPSAEIWLAEGADRSAPAEDNSS